METSAATETASDERQGKRKRRIEILEDQREGDWMEIGAGAGGLS